MAGVKGKLKPRDCALQKAGKLEKILATTG